MSNRMLHSCLCLLAVLWMADWSPASARDEVVACHTQQQIEQVIRDKGQILPDGCRKIGIKTVDTPSGELCTLDLSRPDGGLTGAIVDATTDTQWWVRCRDLERR